MLIIQPDNEHSRTKIPVMPKPKNEFSQITTKDLLSKNNCTKDTFKPLKQAKKLTFKGSFIPKNITMSAKDLLETKNIQSYLNGTIYEDLFKSIQNDNKPLHVSRGLISSSWIATRRPVKALKEGFQYLFGNAETKKSMNKYNNNKLLRKKLKGFYAELEVINEQIKNKKFASDKEKHDFIQKALLSKIDKKSNTLHGPFGSQISSFVNRMVSGVIGCFFVATDFANLRRLSDDDPKAAQKEFKSKFKQDFARVTLTGVVGYYLNSMLMKATNSNMKFAVGLNGAIIVASEVLSRAFTGRPILPQLGSSKSKKEKDHDDDDDKHIQNKDHDDKTAFKGNHKNVAFTGRLFTNKETTKSFVENLKLLEKVDTNEFKKLINGIKNIKNNAQIKEIKNLNVEKSPEEIIKVFNDLSEKNQYIYTDKNFALKIAERLKDGAVMPFKAIYHLGKSIVKTILSPVKTVTGLVNGVANMFKKGQPQELKLTEDKITPVYVKNVLNNIDAIKNNKTYDADYNVVKLAKDKIFNGDKNEIKKLQQQYASLKTAYVNPSVASYSSSDASSYFKLTGMLSVPFLAIDAYNVSKRDGDNEASAVQKTKNRAVQDVTRQGVSFWVNKVLNNTLKEICNSSLLGLSAVTAGNVSFYEALTRVAVGVPLTQKSKTEMAEIDAKNANKKGFAGAFYRTMNKLTGKKPLTQRAEENKNK